MMTIFEVLFPNRKAAPRQEEPAMYLRRVGNGAFVRYELKSTSTEKVEWVSLQTDEAGNPLVVREPQETTREFSRKGYFSAAGKVYWNLNQLCRNHKGDWAEDIYGRKVLCTKEKYPCFDSYDYLNETRYFRWYFIREGNAVCQVFAADDRDIIYVTEDLQNVEGWAWERMKATGFCQPPKDSAQ